MEDLIMTWYVMDWNVWVTKKKNNATLKKLEAKEGFKKIGI